jgi:hypothetical protein
MSVISTSLRTGIKAAKGGAAESGAQRRRAERTENPARGGGARQARRVVERDTYEAGAAAYAGRPKRAPDLQRFEARTEERSHRNNHAGEGRAARSSYNRAARGGIDVRG